MVILIESEVVKLRYAYRTTRLIQQTLESLRTLCLHYNRKISYINNDLSQSPPTD